MGPNAAGGITVAQQHQESESSNLFNAAVATSQVDLVLSVEAIANGLLSIVQHPYVTESPLSLASDNQTDEQESLNVIFRQLQVTCGVDFAHYKRTTTRRRIFRRMAVYKLARVQTMPSTCKTTPAKFRLSITKC